MEKGERKETIGNIVATKMVKEELGFEEMCNYEPGVCQFCGPSGGLRATDYPEVHDGMAEEWFCSTCGHRVRAWKWRQVWKIET